MQITYFPCSVSKVSSPPEWFRTNSHQRYAPRLAKPRDYTKYKFLHSHDPSTNETACQKRAWIAIFLQMKYNIENGRHSKIESIENQKLTVVKMTHLRQAINQQCLDARLV